MTTPTTPAPPSHARQLADLLLDGELDHFVDYRRRQGHSWRKIARALAEATAGRVDVTDVTLRSWYPAP